MHSHSYDRSMPILTVLAMVNGDRVSFGENDRIAYLLVVLLHRSYADDIIIALKRIDNSLQRNDIRIKHVTPLFQVGHPFLKVIHTSRKKRMRPRPTG